MLGMAVANETSAASREVSVSDRTVPQKKRRKISMGDHLVWVAVVMIAVGAALCLAALLNL